MGIVIKNMNMPKTCIECGFCTDDAICCVMGEDLFDYLEDFTPYIPDNWKCEDCPLVEIEE